MVLDLPQITVPNAGIEEQVKAEVRQMVQESASLGVKKQKISIANLGSAPVCPQCSSMLTMAEGCMKCDGCGYSKCG